MVETIIDVMIGISIYNTIYPIISKVVDYYIFKKR